MLVEVKNEYLLTLCELLRVPIFQGISSIYDAAVEYKKKTNTAVAELRIFQDLLKNVVPKWPQNILEKEVERIHATCKERDLVEDLFRAILKTYILIQTQVPSFAKMTYVNRSHFEDPPFSTFIHKCYILCARQFYNYPFLFVKQCDPKTIKDQQKETLRIIDECISQAIRQSLPLREILAEYLEEPNTKKSAFPHSVSLLADDGTNVMDQVFSTYNIKETLPNLLPPADVVDAIPPVVKLNDDDDNIVEDEEDEDGNNPKVSETTPAVIPSNHSITNFLMEDPKMIRSESIIQSPVE